jgi:hypothetical protein
VRARALLARAALLAGSVLVAALAAEAAVRVLALGRKKWGPPWVEDHEHRVLAPATGLDAYARRTGDFFLPYELTPGTDVLMCYQQPTPAWFDGRGCVPVRINELGLRDREVPREPAPGTRRLISVGDSFTFGLGIRLEDTWPKQLERGLRERDPAIEVLNAGFAGGYEISHYVTWLIRKGFALKPEGVVLGVCLNDVGNVPMTIYEPSPIAFPLRRWSRLADLLVGWLEDRRATRVPDPDACWSKYQRGHPAGEPWLWWEEALVTAQGFCRTQDARLLVVVFPMMVSLDAHYPFLRFHEAVVEACRREGIACLDMLPGFLGRDARSLWVHPADQHLAPEGNRLAARALRERLERDGWVR